MWAAQCCENGKHSDFQSDQKIKRVCIFYMKDS